MDIEVILNKLYRVIKNIHEKSNFFGPLFQLDI